MLKSAVKYAHWDSSRPPAHIKIDLAAKKLTDEGFARLIPDIVKQALKAKSSNWHQQKSCPTLLDCSVNHLANPENFRNLCAKLDDIGCFIYHWRCHQNCFGDNFVEFLAEYISTHTSCIHEVHLSHNFITQVGAIHVLQGLKSNAHYPRKIQRGKQVLYAPLWLRLEHNCIDMVGASGRAFLQEIRTKIPTCQAETHLQCTASYCASEIASTVKLHFHWRATEKGAQKPFKKECYQGRGVRHKLAATKDLPRTSLDKYQQKIPAFGGVSASAKAPARASPPPVASQSEFPTLGGGGDFPSLGAPATKPKAKPAAAKPKSNATRAPPPTVTTERPPEFKPSPQPSFDSCEPTEVPRSQPEPAPTMEVPPTQPEPAMEPTQDEPLEAVFRKTQPTQLSYPSEGEDAVDAVLNQINNITVQSPASFGHVQNASQELSQDSSAYHTASRGLSPAASGYSGGVREKINSNCQTVITYYYYLSFNSQVIK